MELRRSKRHTSFRKRCISTTPNDRIRKVELESQIFILQKTMEIYNSNSTEYMQLIYLLGKLVNELQNLIYIPTSFHLLPPPPRKYKQIKEYDNFLTESEFRLGSTDNLKRLYTCLRVPQYFILDNGQKINGEEVFLYTLKRLLFPRRHQDMIEEFGGEITFWSRAFNRFIKHLRDQFLNKLVNSIVIWHNQFNIFANAIKNKLLKKELNFMENVQLLICGFIDDTQIETCTPGGGPTSGGQNAPRTDPIFQEAFYQGWTHIHGVKFQLEIFPNGMIGISK